MIYKFLLKKIKLLIEEIKRIVKFIKLQPGYFSHVHSVTRILIVSLKCVMTRSVINFTVMLFISNSLQLFLFFLSGGQNKNNLSLV